MAVRSKLPRSKSNHSDGAALKAMEGEFIAAGVTQISDPSELFALTEGYSSDAEVEDARMVRLLERETTEVADDSSNEILNNILWEIKKDNDLINSSGGMNRLQKLVSNFLLWNASNNIGKRRMHKCTIKEIADFFYYDKTIPGGGYASTIAKTLVELTKIKINLIRTEPDGRKVLSGQTGILAEFYISKNDGLAYYSLHPIAEALMLDSVMSSRINIEDQRNLKSKYSLSMMELLMRYMGGSSPVQDVGIWRIELGAEQNTYEDFKIFNSKVLKPSIAELREQGVMDVEMKVHKVDRKVVALSFDVRPTEESLGTIEASMAAKDSPVTKRLLALGVKPALAVKSVIKDKNWANEIAEYVEKKTLDGEVKNTASYTTKLLTGDVQVKSDFERAREEAEKKRKQKAERKAVKDAKEREEQEQKRKELEKSFFNEIVNKAINALSHKDLANHASRASRQRGTGATKEEKIAFEELVSRMQTGPNDYDKHVIQEVVTNKIFRTYMYGEADPGGKRLMSMVSQHFMPQTNLGLV